MLLILLLCAQLRLRHENKKGSDLYINYMERWGGQKRWMFLLLLLVLFLLATF